MDDASPAPLDVQVAITLCSIGYLGEGTSMDRKRERMLAALAKPDLPMVGRWTLAWGPAEYETDLWYIAEGPDAAGVPTLALVIRGTQMHRVASLRQDLEPGQVPLPFAYPNESPGVKVSMGFSEAFGRLLQCRDGGLDALSYLRGRLGDGPGPEQIHVAGHSLGGGLAPMVGLWLAGQFPQRSITVFPFGGQSTGNAAFASDYRTTFPEQPSRWITDLDVTPLMFADLGQLPTFWPGGPNPPAWLVELIDVSKPLWSQYRSTDDPHVFHATMYMGVPLDPDPWETQVPHQHEHRYYMYLAGIPKAAITNTFGPWYPPPGKPGKPPPPPGGSHEAG